LRRRTKPLHRLADNVALLEDLVDHPEKFGAWILLNKMKNSKSKVPTNINLLEFKIEMEDEIWEIVNKIEKKLGFTIPDGLK